MIVMLMKRATQLGAAVLVISTLEGGLFAASPSIASATATPVTSGSRSVYLNGIDVSSTRSQDLRNVHIKISDNGDIYITAPQYQVTEEETFLPLSSFSSKPPMPEHKPPQAMSAPKSPGETAEKPTTKAASEATAAPAQRAASSLPAQPASSNPPKSGG